MTSTTPHDSTPRLNFAHAAPDAFKAILALDASWRPHVDPVVAELVNIRVSQLNGCAYCLHMHTSDAAKAGESQERLHMVQVWRDAPSFFADTERAALALAEEITLVGDQGITDEMYQHALDSFGEEGTAHLLAQIMTINTWNRIARATQKVPGTDERAK